LAQLEQLVLRRQSDRTGAAHRASCRRIDHRSHRHGHPQLGGRPGDARVFRLTPGLEPHIRALSAAGWRSVSKLATMAEAVASYVPDGTSVVIGTALEPAIPFAAGHEIIRQRRRDLTLIGPIWDSLFDQLIGGGCVARVCAAWVGNVSEGLGHCYRRATEQGRPRPLEVRDHSNFSISLALWAAAWGSPYIPTRTLLGSDILRTNPDLDQAGGSVQVRPIRPDVAILHVQRADPEGRAHLWGPLGITEEAGLAASQAIVCCEELVASEVILSDPNRVLLPETKVVAVVHEPGGAHPAPLQGF